MRLTHLIFVLLCICPIYAQETGQETAQKSAPKTILVTGFEPFGKRSENISWEAVKELDQQIMGNYKIYALQLPVVWGKPMPLLETFIEKHKPVAIFSFGQGAPGIFKFEQVGLNQRRFYRDNKQQTPQQKMVLKNGPKQYINKLDTSNLQVKLRELGFPFAISTNAGQYLCDECTYSLLHLQQKHTLKAVAFFHIPPYDSEIIINEKQQKMSNRNAQIFAKAVLQMYIESNNQAAKSITK